MNQTTPTALPTPVHNPVLLGVFDGINNIQNTADGITELGRLIDEEGDRRGVSYILYALSQTLSAQIECIRKELETGFPVE
jgi:hypothetical protein